MEGSVVSEVVLNLIYKRLRALKKKYNRIVQMEKSLSQGKTLNKEQEEVLRSKPGVVILIDEYEKLRVAIQEEVNQNQKQESATEDLVNHENNYKPLPFPSKQEWLASWFHDGKLNWRALGTTLFFMHKITVAPLFTEEKGGFGLVFSNKGYKPIVAATGMSLTGPVSLHFHELQGVRTGLEYVLKYKKKFDRIGEVSLEVHCTCEIIWEVLCHVFDTASPNTRVRSPRMGTIKYFFTCAGVYFDERWTELILNIHHLCKELYECDINITFGLGNEAAYFMAKRRMKFSPSCEQVRGSAFDIVAVAELKPDDFPEELKEILYQATLNAPYKY